MTLNLRHVFVLESAVQDEPSQEPPGEQEDYFQTELLKLHLKKTCGSEKQDYTVHTNLT